MSLSPSMKPGLYAGVAVLLEFLEGVTAGRSPMTQLPRERKALRAALSGCRGQRSHCCAVSPGASLEQPPVRPLVCEGLEHAPEPNRFQLCAASGAHQTPSSGCRAHQTPALGRLQGPVRTPSAS